MSDRALEAIQLLDARLQLVERALRVLTLDEGLSASTRAGIADALNPEGDAS